MECSNVPFTTPFIQAWALNFAQSLVEKGHNHYKSFKASNGWIEGEKRRLGLKAIVAHGEAGSVKESLVPEERRRLQTLLADYDPEDIYNADETGLFYQMTPTRFLSTTNRPGVKKAKARFTALLTSNATGTRLLKIWIIGKAKKPRSFLKTDHGPASTLPVIYKHNSKAWMTLAVWKEYMLWLDELVAPRKIVLLVDNFAGHGDAEDFSHLGHIRLEFLAPNMTSRIQPMDQGIIQSVKLGYRRRLVRWLVDHHLAGEVMKKVQYRQAIDWFAEAWDATKQETIANCWRHAGILPPRMQSEEEFDDRVAEIAKMLADLTPQCGQNEEEFAEGVASIERMLNDLDIPVSARQYVEAAHREEGLQYVLSNDEIIDALVGHAVEEEEEDEEPISIAKASDAVKLLMCFCRQQGGDFANSVEPKLREIMERLEGKDVENDGDCEM